MSKIFNPEEIRRIRADFPLLANYPDTAYLDNAATTQKPACVLNALRDYYECSNANPLRGLYDLSVRATDVYEDAREAVRGFINAASTEEIIFTRNASESLNLIAYSAGSAFLKPGDEILIYPVYCDPMWAHRDMDFYDGPFCRVFVDGEWKEKDIPDTNETTEQ